MSLNHIQVFDKPSGFNSHSASQSVEGWVEYISRKLNKEFFLCHRLDKETSGAILLAETKQASRQVYDLFILKKVRKKYLFVTDREIKKDNFNIQANIQKQKNRFVSSKENVNSETEFKLQKSHKQFFLWEAYPLTGKTHQIRIHAKEGGIPILGDSLYDGTGCFRIMLHSQKIGFQTDDDQEFFVPEPVYFQNLDLLDDLEFCQLIDSIDTRINIFSKDGSFQDLPNTLRLIHTEHPWLQCDKLNDVLWFSSFHPKKQVEDILPLILRLKEYFPFNKYFLRLMPNRGQDPQKKITAVSDNLASEWEAKENELELLVKTTRGTSSGIFLDQRHNRNWIYKNSKNKKVLNLYSYTSLFSVAAALGGAKEVVSVDSSKANLVWSKENFELNRLNPENYEFWNADSEMFLKVCVKRKRFFDQIICDPPSFSRYKKTVFKIEKAFVNLLILCHCALNKNGILIVTSNFEKWSHKDFEKRIPSNLFDQLIPPVADYDFGLPGENPILKCFYLKKI